MSKQTLPSVIVEGDPFTLKWAKGEAMSDPQSQLAAALERVGIETSEPYCPECGVGRETMWNKSRGSMVCCACLSRNIRYIPLPLPALTAKAEAWLCETEAGTRAWNQELQRVAENGIGHEVAQKYPYASALRITESGRARAALAAMEKHDTGHD